MDEQGKLIDLLHQVLRQKVNVLQDDAATFANQYGGEVIGNRSLESYQSWYDLLVDGKARVYWTDDTDSVSKDSQGNWTFGLNKNDHITASQHEASHALFSPFDLAGKVAARLQDPRIHAITNAIEDRRIEFLGDLWWTGADIYGHHRADLIRQVKDELDPVISDGDQDDLVVKTVMAIVYDLPVLVYDGLALAIAKEFGDKIKSAGALCTHCRPGEGHDGCGLDGNASVKVAVEIANFMDWWPTRNKDADVNIFTAPKQGEPKDTEPTTPGEGEGEGDTPSPDGEDGADANTSEGGDATSGPPRSYVEQFLNPNPVPATKLGLPSLEDAQAQVETEVASAMKVEAKVLQDYLKDKPHEVKTQAGHTAQIKTVETEPVVPNARVKAMLSSMPSLSTNTKLDIQGVVTPKVWQIRQGNLRVFKKPPKIRGKTLIFVDFSGSMSCNCESCNTRIVTKLATSNAGYKAWQAAYAIAKATGNAEVYAFTGEHYIMRVQTGHQPVHGSGSRLRGSTPICTALLYAETLMGGANSKSTLVFITDGEPSVYGACYDAGYGSRCTRAVADRLHQAGADFVAVCIHRSEPGSFEYKRESQVFPASVVAHLHTHEPIDEISNLASAIQYIRNR